MRLVGASDGRVERQERPEMLARFTINAVTDLGRLEHHLMAGLEMVGRCADFEIMIQTACGTCAVRR